MYNSETAKQARAKVKSRGQNKLTRTVKETVLSVFNEIQSDPKNSLISFAKKYPRDFYQIASRLIPTEITGTVKTVIKVTDTHE